MGLVNTLLIAEFFSYLFGVTSMVIIGTFLRYITQVGKREFSFYFARGCCEIIQRVGNDVEKMKYLYLLLESYNKYLRRNIRFEVKDIDKIYSQILYTDNDEKDRIVKTICDSLRGDRLDLAKFLSTVYKVPGHDLFSRESLIQQLKSVGSFLVVVIPIAISITSLILQTQKAPSP